MTSKTTECNDGLICENSAPCIPHPTKESKYMCDCNLAEGSNDLVKFAGVYCEHQATSYCQKGSSTSEHAFCTNGGECKVMVGRREEHAGCKCPTGYEGQFCQFVRGSRPSDWELTDFMHPALVNAYGGTQAGGNSALHGIIIGATVGLVIITCFVMMYLFCAFDDLRSKLRRNQKEMDTGAPPTSTAPPSNSQFMGGKSVYQKKTSTRTFVTETNLEADEGGLAEARLDDQNLPSMEEVDLDSDKPTGELA
eukprot:CAMPEP_0181101192 /NCGR_PEP_ID=MMETSP1071-20121207/13617_1 /TAXON_ID=35127 /ORGANISM="Thalassiosira sp., Strain NH16" /LENGTH=251 /DNA_ID=CAMNT_0023184015 /DNA_START=161 /DNA_END=916 /DNA_ORIENTATION=+